MEPGASGLSPQPPSWGDNFPPTKNQTLTAKAMSLLLSIPGTELIYTDSHSITTATVWTVVRHARDLNDPPLEGDLVIFSKRELIELIGDNSARSKELTYPCCYWTGDKWSDQWTVPSDEGIPREVVKKVEIELIKRRQGK